MADTEYKYLVEVSRHGRPARIGGPNFHTFREHLLTSHELLCPTGTGAEGKETARARFGRGNHGVYLNIPKDNTHFSDSKRGGKNEQIFESVANQEWSEEKYKSGNGLLLTSLSANPDWRPISSSGRVTRLPRQTRRHTLQAFPEKPYGLPKTISKFTDPRCGTVQWIESYPVFQPTFTLTRQQETYLAKVKKANPSTKISYRAQRDGWVDDNGSAGGHGDEDGHGHGTGIHETDSGGDKKCHTGLEGHEHAESPDRVFLKPGDWSFVRHLIDFQDYHWTDRKTKWKVKLSEEYTIPPELKDQSFEVEATASILEHIDSFVVYSSMSHEENAPLPST